MQASAQEQSPREQLCVPVLFSPSLHAADPRATAFKDGMAGTVHHGVPALLLQEPAMRVAAAYVVSDCLLSSSSRSLLSLSLSFSHFLFCVWQFMFSCFSCCSSLYV